LILIVCAVILTNLGSFGFIFQARYLHLTHEWGIAPLISHTCQVLGSVASLVEFAGIVLIASPFGSHAIYRWPFLGYVTVILAAVYPLTEALWRFTLVVWGVDVWVTSILSYAWVFPVTSLSYWIAIVLLWIILISRIDRTTNRQLRFLGYLSIAAAFLAGLDDLLTGLVIPYIRWFDDIVFINPYELGEWWGRYIDTACWIVILITIGMFLRGAMLTRPGLIGTGKHAERPDL